MPCVRIVRSRHGLCWRACSRSLPSTPETPRNPTIEPSSYCDRNRAPPVNRNLHPRPRKALGQHFLSDPHILARIADALELHPDENVIEIGAGRGALTKELAKRARNTYAIELDRVLADRLREKFAGEARVHILQGDALRMDLFGIVKSHYALAGNIPYYITTPLLFHALKRPRPSRAVFLVQREVAERMTAKAGTRAYGALSVNLQAVAKPEMLFRVAPGSFQPPPTVESAVVRIRPRPDPVVPPEREEALRAFVIAVFGMRRKQMRRVLREISGLDAASAAALLSARAIDPEARPETLTPEQFAGLLEGVVLHS